MLIAINIGNTTVTSALFSGAKLVDSWRVRSDPDETPDGYGILLDQLLRQRGRTAAQLAGAAIASVVPPLTPVLRQVCRNYLGQEPLIAEAGMDTGLRIHYAAGELGIDRLLDGAAAKALYGLPACVIDFGTATTFNAVDANSSFLGGAIAPGISIAARALFERASALRPVELDSPPSAVGRNIRRSVQSGVVFGYVALVEGIVNRYRVILGPDMRVIATGGSAHIVARQTAVIDVVDPWLTLRGLRLVYELNRG